MIISFCVEANLDLTHCFLLRPSFTQPGKPSKSHQTARLPLPFCVVSESNSIGLCAFAAVVTAPCVLETLQLQICINNGHFSSSPGSALSWVTSDQSLSSQVRPSDQKVLSIHAWTCVRLMYLLVVHLMGFMSVVRVLRQSRKGSGYNLLGSMSRGLPLPTHSPP